MENRLLLNLIITGPLIGSNRHKHVYKLIYMSFVQPTQKFMSNNLQYLCFCFRLYVRPYERLGHLDNN